MIFLLHRTFIRYNNTKELGCMDTALLLFIAASTTKRGCAVKLAKNDIYIFVTFYFQLNNIINTFYLVFILPEILFFKLVFQLNSSDVRIVGDRWSAEFSYFYPSEFWRFGANSCKIDFARKGNINKTMIWMHTSLVLCFL